MSSNVSNKTVRPSSFSYSYYRSSPQTRSRTATKKRFKLKGLTVILIVAIACVLGFKAFASNKPKTVDLNNAKSTTSTTTKVPAKKTTPAASTTTKAPVTTVAAAPNECAGNDLSELIKVSIKAQHLWACEEGTQLYDSPVITGVEAYADTLTPIGTYHIYEKETNKVLTGSSSLGTWRDPVSYWMPFLDNQYGAYGLHDATWRNSDQFGNLNPYTSDQGSNGCVELPLATASWLYHWAYVGTTVSIVS